MKRMIFILLLGLTTVLWAADVGRLPTPQEKGVVQINEVAGLGFAEIATIAVVPVFFCLSDNRSWDIAVIAKDSKVINAKADAVTLSDNLKLHIDPGILI